MGNSGGGHSERAICVFLAHSIKGMTLVEHLERLGACLIAPPAAWTHEAISIEVTHVKAVCDAVGDAGTFIGEHHDAFHGMCKLLWAERLGNRDWRQSNPRADWSLCCVQLARIMLRERELQDEIFDENLIEEFVDLCDWMAAKYLSSPTIDTAACVRGLLSMSQKLCNSEEHIDQLGEAGLHTYISFFLAGKDMVVLQGTLQVLGSLCESSVTARLAICQSNTLDHAVALLADHADLVTQKLCASLLRILCVEHETREQLKVYDAVPILISLLSTRNVRLQWHLAHALAQMAEDKDCAQEMAQMGLLGLLNAELADSEAMAPTHPQFTDRCAMLTAVCELLTQLSRNDAVAMAIVQENTVYMLSRHLLLPSLHAVVEENANYTLLQCAILRVLRLIFSLERNRHVFKKLFPPAFFSAFIDIGHYVLDMSEYRVLAAQWRLALAETPSQLALNVEAVNLKRQPISHIREYAVMEQLGAGAFGCVYRVTATNKDDRQYALKEIFQSGTMQLDDELSEIASEVRMIRNSLRHPNIVRYRKVFLENQRLYILMDMIEGASLKEHITSTKEKDLRFGVDRVWSVVIQMTLALRYLHKAKHILHRDLKPNNIMMTDNDRIVITDFGLAKHRTENEYLKSNVGTILYSCPEMVQDLPYGERADIWSFGCCIYEMCVLQPPFHTTNQLLLAKAIVEAKYEPIPPEHYPADLRAVVDACLQAEPSRRPDTVQLGGMIASQLMDAVDDVLILQANQQTLESRRGGALSADPLQPDPVASPTPDAKVAPPSGRTAARKLKKRALRAVRALPGNAAVPSDVKAAVKRHRVRTASAASLVLPRIESEARNLVSRSATHNAVGGRQRRTAWDSGMRRAASSTEMTSQPPARSFHSATSLVSVHSAHMRPMGVDPIVQMLSAMHDMETVVRTPSDTVNDGVALRRRLVANYHRRLFARTTTPQRMKAEMRKLVNQSDSIVDMNLGYVDYTPVLLGLECCHDLMPDERTTGLTYEQLWGVMTAVLTTVTSSTPTRPPTTGDRPPSRQMTPGIRYAP